MWEIKVGYIGEDDFAISNTTGDSGKTAVIKTDIHNKMPLVYYDPRFLPYSPEKAAYIRVLIRSYRLCDHKRP